MGVSMCDLVKLSIIGCLLFVVLLYQSSLTCHLRQSSNFKLNSSSINESLSRTFSHRLFDYMSFYLRKKPYPGILTYIDYTTTRLNLKPRKDLIPIVPDFVPVFNDVSFNYTIEITPQCKAVSSDNEISLLIIINSAPNNMVRRSAVRKTWLRHLNKLSSNNTKSINLVGVAFFVGKSTDKVNSALMEESLRFRDILQVDSIDSYYDMSVKVTSLLNWIVTKCGNVDFVLKVDDDVYVNVRNLAKFLQQADDSSAYGTAADGVVQDIGKWRMSPHEYPWKSYPTYFQGPAVLLPGKSVNALLAAAQTIPYHPFDDLYLTGFCAERARLPLFNCDSFLDRLTRPSPGACFAFFTVAWITWKEEQMTTSQLDVENVYNNVTQCRRFNTKTVVDPNQELKFELMKVSKTVI